MKTTALLVALLAASALAECPNACSGHGRCNNYKMVFNQDTANNAFIGATVVDTTGNVLGYDSSQSALVKDSCTCYARREGTQVDANVGANAASGGAAVPSDAQLVFAWTGPDCSLRTCPLGISWGFGGPTAANSHSQKLECSGQGLCDRKTGECDCFDGYTGEGCRRSTCPNDCSGHGVCQSQFQFAEDVNVIAANTKGYPQMAQTACSTTTGTAAATAYTQAEILGGTTCGSGFVTPYVSTFTEGTQCQTSGMVIATNDPSIVTVDTSGRITAVTVGTAGVGCDTAGAYTITFSDYASVIEWLPGSSTSYVVEYATAWDNNKSFGCKCDAGFRGPDCSQIECLSDTDTLAGHGARRGRDCSGRGICDYDSGMCECFTGYRGARCESQDIYV